MGFPILLNYVMLNSKNGNFQDIYFFFTDGFLGGFSGVLLIRLRFFLGFMKK